MNQVLVVTHPICSEISDKEVQEALAGSSVMLTPLKVDSQRIPIAQLSSVNWGAVQTAERNYFQTKVRPVLDKNPEKLVHYFGMTPIPVGIYFGYLYGSERACAVFQKNHQTHKWEGGALGSTYNQKAAVIKHTLQETVSAEGQAIIRVSVSYKIERDQTIAVTSNPLAEMDIEVPQPHPDCVQKPEDLFGVAIKFREALDLLKKFRPNVTLIHLFVSAPPNLTFLLGTKISPTIHPDILTYQYNQSGEPKYNPAFVLRTSSRAEVALTEEQKKRAAAIRGLWNVQIQNLKSFANGLKVYEVKGPKWLTSLFPEECQSIKAISSVPDLTALSEAELLDSKIGDKAISNDVGFFYEPKTREWSLSDELLLAFDKAFPNQKDLERAGRLFLLHESVHIADHQLTRATSPQIGRFPKLLETADYDADVWGVMHEYRFSQVFLSDKNDYRVLFSSIIEAAINSFWAFDDNGQDLPEIQIRRVQRYLNWYWQLISAETSKSQMASIEKLVEKPCLEIAGPEIHSVGERTFFSLRGGFGQPEVCVMSKNRIFRHGEGPATRISNIFRGFKVRSGEDVREGLRSVFDQIPKN
jgi:hypothetical protein